MITRQDHRVDDECRIRFNIKSHELRMNGKLLELRSIAWMKAPKLPARSYLCTATWRFLMSKAGRNRTAGMLERVGQGNGVG